MRWQKAVWLIFWLGLLLGPGMFLYQNLIAGRVVKTIPLVGKVMGMHGIELALQTPVTVHLEPSMNPIAFDFDRSIAPREDVKGGKVDRYRTELALGDRTIRTDVWEAGFGWIRFSGFRIPFAYDRKRLAIFNVHEAGDYQFTMTQTEDYRTATLNQLDLKVVANAYEQDPALLWTGVAMFIGPMIFAYWRITRTP